MWQECNSVTAAYHHSAPFNTSTWQHCQWLIGRLLPLRLNPDTLTFLPALKLFSFEREHCWSRRQTRFSYAPGRPVPLAVAKWPWTLVIRSGWTLCRGWTHYQEWTDTVPSSHALLVTRVHSCPSSQGHQNLLNAMQCSSNVAGSPSLLNVAAAMHL